MPTMAFDSIGLRCTFYDFGVNDNNGEFAKNGIPPSAAAYPYDGMGRVGGIWSAGFGSGGNSQGLIAGLRQYAGEEGGIDLVNFSGGAQTSSNVLSAHPDLVGNIVSTTNISPGL